ncbi:MAG: GIDE domain-containing protein [Cyanobacteria bacterium J06623_7]
MNTIIFIAGWVILAIAIMLLIRYYWLKIDIRAIRGTEISNLAALRNRQAKFSRSTGRVGTWREQVEVRGTVRCDRPLTAELSSRQCIYYQTKIEEEYERTECCSDADENRPAKQQRGTKLVKNYQNRTNFYLADGTDTISVNLNEAEIDGMTVVNQLESCNRVRANDYRVLGYQRTEKVIELGAEIYIIGEVKDINGQLQISAAEDRRKPFVISFKSEAELLAGRLHQCRQQLYWGLGLSLCGSLAIAYAQLAMLV